MKKFFPIFFIFILVFFSFYPPRGDSSASFFEVKNTAFEGHPRFIPLDAEVPPPPPQYGETYLLVQKKRHKLHVIQNEERIKTYTVNVRTELPDREVWEDDQTPEGVFEIETMEYTAHRGYKPWLRWMRLNTMKKAREIYIKNHEDGLERIQEFENAYGEIDSDLKIRQFNTANRDQKMLRGVGIHGGGYFPENDWTQGCVGMENRDVVELFDILKKTEGRGIGIKVVIEN